MRETREQIIQVAGRLFLHRNYDGVSIQDITRAAGMTKGALYHHFTGKEQLFEEVAHDLVGSFHTDFSALPGDSLRHFYTTLVERIRSRGEGGQRAGSPAPGINVYNLLWDAVRILPGFRAAMEAFNTLEHQAWTAAIQAGIDRGEIRGGLEAGQLARIFMAVPDGVTITSMLKGGPASGYGEIQGLWDALYQALKQ